MRKLIGAIAQNDNHLYYDDGSPARVGDVVTFHGNTTYTYTIIALNQDYKGAPYKGAVRLKEFPNKPGDDNYLWNMNLNNAKKVSIP